MKDKLHRFVRDNREAFEAHEPSEGFWERLEAKLPEPTPTATVQESEKTAIVHEDFQNNGSFVPSQFKILRNFNWRIAASIALIVSLGWVGYRVNRNYGITESPEVAFTNPSFAKQVSQYTQLIDNKRAELHTLTENNPELSKEFATELQQLEQTYQNLKADLPQNPNQEALIQAMIQNLQWQIDLLNQQLDIIQRIKNKSNHETNKLI